MSSDIKILERLFTKGEISRREFVAKVSMLGLATAISPLFLSRKANALTPKRGGRLRVGSADGSVSDSLDPAILMTMYAITLNMQLHNYLLELDHNGNAIPELATSFEPIAGGKEWIFKLRKDVVFHNGKKFDAKDVVFSINHHRGEESKSRAKAVLSMIEDVKAESNDTVKFILDSINADFPFIMTSYRLSMMPAGSNPADGIGTGAFQLERFEPGVGSLVKRNQNYWKEGLPYFDEIEMLVIPDGSARNTALTTGQVDVINRVDRKTADLIGKAKGYQLIEAPGTMHYTFTMFSDHPPYDNNDVRLALKYAIDREALLKTVLRGHGYVGNDNPIGRSIKYFNSDLPQRKYDPEKAIFHIKKAGMEGHEFKLHVSDAAFTGAVDAAVLYKEHAAKAGINIKPVLEPQDGYWKNVWMKKPWVAVYWLGRATCDWTFSYSYAREAKYNDMHWKNPRFNMLLKEARKELDDTKRREMYYEMQKLVHDEGSIIIPLFANHLEAASEKVKHDSLAGNMELDGGRFHERWWFGS
jgi:peptide/nickel transport system substrate-binding protein